MKNRNCRKCNKIIPYRTKIDGKYKVLSSRKFCLDCSPWGKFNRKTDDPSRPVKIRDYKTYNAEEKIKHIKGIYLRGLTRKRELIKMAGGKCTVCGYCKCEQAMCFHHLDRATKCFALSLDQLWSHSWEAILEEFRKVQLLCLNCHAEIEALFEDKKTVSCRKLFDKQE